MELSEAAIAAYNACYDRGFERVRSHLLIDGERRTGNPWWLARRSLRKGIAEFEAALAIAPDMWECHFWIGKALQRLGEHRDAMSHLSQALLLEPDNPTIAKEAANEALALGEYQTGIAFLRPAVASRPDDPVLHYNLGIQLLLAGKVRDAFNEVTEAARLEAHPATGALLDLIEDVLAGRRRQPRNYVELVSGA